MLIDLIAARAALPRKRAESVVNILFNSLADGFVEGRRAEMRGFGSFTVKEYPAYLGRNPRTGNQVPVPAKRAIKFKAGKALVEMVNAGD
jgi:integration host factor subunit beta